MVCLIKNIQLNQRSGGLTAIRTCSIKLLFLNTVSSTKVICQLFFTKYLLYWPIVYRSALQASKDTVKTNKQMNFKAHGKTLSPAKTRHQFALVIQIFLNFLSHVENGTVPTGTQHILMKRTLTSLTLSPKARKVLFQRI